MVSHFALRFCRDIDFFHAKPDGLDARIAIGFALIEVGGSSIPGGGGVEWLSALVGRSRTLEIVLSADDFDADIGERYGFVNRALPDADLDAYLMRNEDPAIKKPELPVITTKSTLFFDSRRRRPRA